MKPKYRPSWNAYRDLSGQYVVINESLLHYPVIGDEPTVDPDLVAAATTWLGVEDEHGEAAHIGIYRLERVPAAEAQRIIDNTRKFLEDVDPHEHFPGVDVPHGYTGPGWEPEASDVE